MALPVGVGLPSRFGTPARSVRAVYQPGVPRQSFGATKDVAFDAFLTEPRLGRIQDE